MSAPRPMPQAILPTRVPTADDFVALLDGALEINGAVATVAGVAAAAAGALLLGWLASLLVDGVWAVLLAALVASFVAPMLFNGVFWATVFG